MPISRPTFGDRIGKRGHGRSRNYRAGSRRTVFAHRDQFAPELIHFADCLLRDEKPEPCGHEGLADVRIIHALYESARNGAPVMLPEFHKDDRPNLAFEIHRPPHKKPKLIHAANPTG